MARLPSDDGRQVLSASLAQDGGVAAGASPYDRLRNCVRARMQLRGLQTYEEYARLLDGEPAERAALAQSLRLAAELGQRPGQPSSGRGLRYRWLFEEGPAPIILTDLKGIIREANARGRELLGLGESSADSSLAGYLAEDSRPPLSQALRALSHQEEVCLQLRLTASPERTQEARARRITCARETLVQWLLHDVTAYLQAPKQRHQLVNLLLHDLRSPLATALLGLGAIERSLQRQDTARAQQALASTSATLRRLSRLADSLLDVARLEAGQPNLQLAPVRAEDLLSEVAAEAAPGLAARQLQLKLQLPDGLPRVLADREMLFRAVLNLLDNAVKFSSRGSQVTLQAAHVGSDLAISVTDQRPGIPRALQPHIFEPFSAIPASGGARSYGLGLAFCKLAAESHGGRITLESDGSRGSTFTLWLPAAAEPTRP